MPQMHILVPLSVVKNCNANLLLADYVSNEIMLHQGAPANDNSSRLDLISWRVRWSTMSFAALETIADLNTQGLHLI